VPLFMGITGVNEHIEPVFNAVLSNAVVMLRSPLVIPDKRGRLTLLFSRFSFLFCARLRHFLYRATPLRFCSNKHRDTRYFCWGLQAGLVGATGTPRALKKKAITAFLATALYSVQFCELSDLPLYLRHRSGAVGLPLGDVQWLQIVVFQHHSFCLLVSEEN